MHVHPVYILCYLCAPVCVCLRGVWMEQSANAARVRSLIPIGSDDANDACTHRMMNAMELKRGSVHAVANVK